MLKKIVLTILFVGVTGALIWGGVNRTLAKTGNDESVNGQGRGQYSTQDGNRSQQHGLDESDADPGSNASGWVVDSVQEEIANLQGNQNQGNGYQGGRGGNASRGQGKAQGTDPLDEDEIQAVQLALDDEYHALAIYQSVIETFGEVAPFVEVAQSEQHHIEALITHFDKHGIAVPENPWIGQIPPFDSIEAACQAGVDDETAKAPLYDQLFSMTDDPGLIQVFTNLRTASLESHLSQFEACR